MQTAEVGTHPRREYPPEVPGRPHREGDDTTVPIVN
jgi:hypothetical protein